MIGLSENRIIKPASIIVTQDLKTNLSHCWELNESSGTTLYAAYGTYNQTAYNSPTVGTTALMDKGVKLSYTSTNYIQATNLSPNWNVFTVNVWYYPITLYSLCGIALYGKSVSDSYQYLSWQLSVTNSNTYFNICEWTGSAGIAHNCATTTNVSTGAWHMFTGVKTATGTQLYIDGVLAATATFTYTTRTISGYYFKQGSSYANRNPHGIIDQTALWSNRALIADEISYLYNSGAGLPYTSWTY